MMPFRSGELINRVRELLREQHSTAIDERRARNVLGYELRPDHPWANPPLKQVRATVSEPGGAYENEQVFANAEFTG